MYTNKSRYSWHKSAIAIGDYIITTTLEQLNSNEWMDTTLRTYTIQLVSPGHTMFPFLTYGLRDYTATCWIVFVQHVTCIYSGTPLNGHAPLNIGHLCITARNPGPKWTICVYWQNNPSIKAILLHLLIGIPIWKFKFVNTILRPGTSEEDHAALVTG